MLMIEKTEEKLEQVLYIWYLITFKDPAEALLDSRNKVNAISQVLTFQLDFKTWKTNIGAQKIDNITLETYEIVVFIFSISDKDGREVF